MMHFASIAHSQQLHSVLNHPVDASPVDIESGGPNALHVKTVDTASAKFDSAKFDSPEFDSPEFDSAKFDSVPVNSRQRDADAAAVNLATTPPIDAGQKIDALITKMVLQNIPHQFREDKDWGGQQSRWNGVDVAMDGLKIKTHRKKKMVNHGTWKKYEVSLLNPAQQFFISIKNMRESDEGKINMDVHIAANLKIDGRQAKWVKGVQIFNVSVDGKTKIELVTTIQLRSLMDMTKFPPDLVFRPQATAVKISIKDFRIDRISKVGGEVTQQVSRLAHRSIEDRLKSEEAKMIQKINEQFDDNAEKFRLSMHDAMSTRWSAVAQKLMPADGPNALGQSTAIPPTR